MQIVLDARWEEYFEKLYTSDPSSGQFPLGGRFAANLPINETPLAEVRCSEEVKMKKWMGSVELVQKS